MEMCVWEGKGVGKLGSMGGAYEWILLWRTHLLCFYFGNWKYTTYHKSLVFSLLFGYNLKLLQYFSKENHI